MTGPSLKDEVTFLIGVDDKNTAAKTAYATWQGSTIPAVYGEPSKAIKWGNPTPGTGATVSYHFDGASSWTDEEKAAWEGAFALWSAVANVTFVEQEDADVANVTIERGGEGSGAGAAFGSRNTVAVGSSTIGTPGATGSEIEIETTAADFGPIGYTLATHGGHPFLTLIHEIGHTIGIGHGGPYNDTINKMTQQFGPYDTTLWTLMSYISPTDPARSVNDYPVKGTSWGSVFEADHNWEFEPLTPMMLDILAAQRLYGVATSGPLAAGNVTFGFNSNIDVDGFLGRIYDFSRNTHPILTLWSGGTGNTLDLSGYTQGAVINLTPGTFSSAGGKVNNIAIAFGTVIEKAIGGEGNDTITASNVASTLMGGDGSDKLYGGAGNDVLTGGEDPDTFDPGGDFMAVARGQGSNAHTMVTFEPFLPNLFEGVRVDAQAINGVVNEPFMTGDGTVRFTMKLETAVSTFANSLGFYKVAADGTIFDPRIVFSNTHNVSAATVDLGSPADAVRIGFFLIQNGFGAYGGLPDNLSFVTPGTGSPANLNAGVPVTLVSGTLGTLTATQVFHSFATLNVSDANQVLSGVAPGGKDLLIGFEDLPTATGDNDFQDVVIRIHTNRDDIFIA